MTILTKTQAAFMKRQTGRVILLMTTLTMSLTSNVVSAGVQTEDEIRLEMSYLAMRLLEIKQVDTYTLESKAFAKPYIGVCSKMKNRGVYLACITPNSQAAKAGLKTGDLVLSINGVSMAGQSDHYDPSGNYWKITHQMKAGDELVFELADGNKTRKVNVIVGSISHPAYRIEVSKAALDE